MKSKKIFILLPDGVGLRNFAFTSFVETGEKLGWKVIFWNHTAFDLSSLGYEEIKLEGRARAKTDLLKRAKIETELDHFTCKFDDPVYQTYKFSASQKGLKNKIKNSIVTFLVNTHRGEEGLQRLRKKMKTSEKKGKFYSYCKAVLEREKPDLVFCTNQRPVNSIAPLTAAQELGIPTATFIFSWDNLPKATMVVEVGYYFVWSEYMKQELLNYYPHIKPEQVFITGSPQFEPHFDADLRQSRQEFFKEHNLEFSKKYVCFSGDDKTTSPDDSQYLDDIAKAISQLNLDGANLGIIFRRCPVDCSDRYNEVLKKHRNLIVPIAPRWNQIEANWNAILPTKEDIALQINTIIHSEAVVNVGSSMVFDFALFGKPCLYINYEAQPKFDDQWSTDKIYNFVHFRSMPNRDEVYWLNSKNNIPTKIELALKNPAEKSNKALEWFKKINACPPSMATRRIWNKLATI